MLATAGIDDARSTRLVVLDPRQFSLLNGVDQETRAAVRAAMGIGPDKLPVGWASSAVFAIVNTRVRGQARGAAVTYLGWDRVAAMDAVRADTELAEQAREEKAEARRKLDAAVRRAYQHVLYLGEGDDAEHPRVERVLTFEQDNESALDGAVVWKALAEKGKAFSTANPLDAKALLHNLADGDYGRPLDEVRDSFWNTPRMPLLPGGDGDLQQAIFEALNAGSLRLIGADGLDRTVTRPGDIGVGQSGLRLAKPETTEPTPGGADAMPPSGSATGGGGGGTSSTTGTKTGTRGGDDQATEKELAFSLISSLTDDTKREAVRLLLRRLTNAVDEGKVSYTQIMLKVVVESSTVHAIVEEARRAGANPTVKDM